AARHGEGDEPTAIRGDIEGLAVLGEHGAQWMTPDAQRGCLASQGQVDDVDGLGELAGDIRDVPARTRNDARRHGADVDTVDDAWRAPSQDIHRGGMSPRDEGQVGRRKGDVEGRAVDGHALTEGATQMRRSARPPRAGGRNRRVVEAHAWRPAPAPALAPASARPSRLGLELVLAGAPLGAATHRW